MVIYVDYFAFKYYFFFGHTHTHTHTHTHVEKHMCTHRREFVDIMEFSLSRSRLTRLFINEPIIND